MKEVFYNINNSTNKQGQEGTLDNNNNLIAVNNGANKGKAELADLNRNLQNKKAINLSEYFLDKNNNLVKIIKTYELKGKVYEVWSLLWLLSWFVYNPQSVGTLKGAKSLSKTPSQKFLLALLLTTPITLKNVRNQKINPKPTTNITETMKIFNKISYLAIIILLASCASSGDKSNEQKSNESCSGNKEESGEVRVIHKSFLERINPINAFAPIFGGIMADVNNIRNELNKNDSTDGNKTSENNNCNAYNAN